MAGRKAIIKKLPIVETLGCVDVICADKTGTLTMNEMTVTHVYAADGEIAEVQGVGYGTSGDNLGEVRSFNGELALPHTHPSLAKVAEVGSVCNNAVVVDGELMRGSPTEGALLAFAMKMGVADRKNEWRRLQEFPFSSETKTMTVKCDYRGGMNRYEDDDEEEEAGRRRKGSIKEEEPTFFFKGAWEQVLSVCTHVYLPNQEIDDENHDINHNLKRRSVQVPPLDEAAKKPIRQMASTWCNMGLRVLGLAVGADRNQLRFVGIVGITDPPRPGVRDSIRTLQMSGVNVKMVTGDAEATARAIGDQLGLHGGAATAISGSQLDAMTTEELAEVLPETNVIYRATPKHKLKLVQALQLKNHVVGMTGDGVNDAVALRSADIGIAMGKCGTDVSKEAADMILVDDDFSTILSAIEEGKCIFHNIRNFVRFQLSTSIAALSLIAISTLFKLPNPLNAMQILWINIIMDGPPAQSLGVEPVDAAVLRQPPRRTSEPIINRKLVVNTLISAFVIVVGTVVVFARELGAGLGDGKIDERTTTMTFTCFVLFDMFNAYSSRSQTRSVIFDLGFFSNRYLLYAVVGSLAGQVAVIYFPPLSAVFQCEPLSIGDVMYLIAIASSVFLIHEVKKLVFGRKAESLNTVSRKLGVKLRSTDWKKNE